MRILLSTIGSRGEVQPIVALGRELRALGHDARLCAPPNFKEWIESFGLACVPIGPDVRTFSIGGGGPPRKPSPEQLQALADGSVREQFRVLTDAARDCTLIVGAGALQIAARSIAESLGVPYVFAAYCPVVLPSPHHPPLKMGTHYSQALPGVVNRVLWMRDARSFNARFRATLNDERRKLGLAPVGDARSHVFTDQPWLASDPSLSPARPTRRMHIVQTGAWLLSDPTPLPHDLEGFLADGEPPVYMGLGSTRTTGQTGLAMIEAARAVGRRVVVSRGWANFDVPGGGTDCIAIGDVDHAKLFPRVAAIVHHGGAGTTTTAARAGRPQVIVPHGYDQYYWSHRIRALGVGASGPARDRITVDALASAIRQCLQPDVAVRARELARRVDPDGARAAARRLVGAPLGEQLQPEAPEALS